MNHAKKLAAVLLLLSIACAVDVQRQETHIISAALTDSVTYADTLHGAVALEAIQSMAENSELAYVKARMPFEVESFTITATNDSLSITAKGNNSSFVTRIGGVLAFGGAPFEDAACASSATSVRSLEQETSTTVVLPANWTIISIPQNKTKQMKLLDYSFSAWADDAGLHQNFALKIKSNATLEQYCTERAEIQRALMQTFVVMTSQRIKASLADAVILLGLGLFLLYGLQYVTRRPKKAGRLAR